MRTINGDTGSARRHLGPAHAAPINTMIALSATENTL